SALGFYHDENVLALDTGCVWNGELTAARLDSETLEVVSVSCQHDLPSDITQDETPGDLYVE
ncbi:MAG: hypothetical protein ACP5D3_05660, partial [Sulfurovum sp.]